MRAEKTSFPQGFLSGKVFCDSIFPPRLVAGLLGLFLVALLPIVSAHAQTSDVVERKTLRVCSDPANLPFSSDDEKKIGFENKIAHLLGEKLGLSVAYTWFPQATGFVRRTLSEKRCDIIIGFAQGHELVQNSNPYYRSAYAMVVKKAGPLSEIKNLDDPRLKQAKIGVIAGTPPGNILALNGLLAQIKGYNLTVDRRHEAPAETMIRDLVKGDIDIALVWGPIGGYFARELGGGKLDVRPMLHETKGPRMIFRITFGIRHGEPDWKHTLNAFITANQAEINTILAEYGVPLVDEHDRLISR